jgi:hypothetical protein
VKKKRSSEEKKNSITSQAGEQLHRGNRIAASSQRNMPPVHCHEYKHYAKQYMLLTRGKAVPYKH